MTNSRTLDFSPAGPVAKAFMASDAFVRLLVGPLGSGKTSAAVVECLRRTQMQKPGPDGKRRVRVGIIRNTFSELKSTTIKSWEQWCPPQYGKLTYGTSPIVHKIETSELDLEVLFVPLDKPEDVRKLLSLELTFAWIDECREIPKEVLDALTGRVGRYPSRMQGGCSWSGIMLTSNPSDTEAWMYALASNPPEGYEVFRQPSGRGPNAENLENLPTGYYQRIAAGKDAEWVKVFIDGEFGFVIEGKPVYPSWRDSVHVPAQRIEPLPGIGLTLGVDFGLTPACAILQERPDGSIVCLDEIVTEDTGIVRFAQALSRYVRQNYPNNPVTKAVGDPAGDARGADEQTAFDIMRAHTPWKWRPAPGDNDITVRIEAVSAALNRMVDGRPGFQLNPSCGTLRKGFSGGYHFQKIQAGNGTTFHETPRKNQYSHPHDALQYGVLACSGADAVLNRDRRRHTRGAMAENIDFDVLNPQGTPERRSGVVWGDGRPAHLASRRQRPAFAANNDFDPFS